MMEMFEYKVVPAPEKPSKIKGVKGGAPRFAHTVEDVLNSLAAEGWSYLRADSLPCTERSGLFARATTVHRSVLVFRRALEQPDAQTGPRLSPRADGLTPDDKALRAALTTDGATVVPARSADAPRLAATRSGGTQPQ